MLQYMDHAKQLASRAPETLNDGADGERFFFPREKLKHVKPLLKSRCAIEAIVIADLRLVGSAVRTPSCQCNSPRGRPVTLANLDTVCHFLKCITNKKDFINEMDVSMKPNRCDRPLTWDLLFFLAAATLGIASPAAALSAHGPARFPYVPTGRLDPARVNVLHASDATRTGEFMTAVPITHLKSEIVAWKDKRQALSWTISAPKTADYVATALLSVESVRPVLMVLSTDQETITTPFAVDPRGYQSRSAFPFPLHLSEGRNVITLRLIPTPGDAPFSAKVLSVELTRPTVRDAFHREALAMRADARWMARERFGIGVHWTKRTMPRTGPAQSYDQAVAHFDVERFADQAASTGASFVYLTTAHSDQYLPAPIKALDAILPGRTARRDLIADLIAALAKRNMKLFLYYHLGPIEDPAWSAATHMWDSDSTRFFSNWQAIIREIGDRYGKGLAGWWFDDGLYNYYYRSPDWAALDRAAKAGNPDRVVCFNSWSAALATEFQDYYCGEEVVPGGLNDFLNHDGSINGTVASGGDGRIRNGQFAGLQAAAMFVVESEWVHDKRDSEASPPKWSAETLAATLKKLKDHRITPMLNMEVYQDGTISPKSIAVVRDAARIAGIK